MARILYTDEEGTLKEFEIGEDEITIGRTPENTIQLSSGFVSRQHAKIFKNRDGEFIVQDLGSHNGTFVNKIQVPLKILTHEDVITIGEHPLKFIEDKKDTTAEPPPRKAIPKEAIVGKLPLGEGELIKTVYGAADASISEFVTRIAPPLKTTPEVTSAMARNLPLIYRIAEKLHQAQTLNELLETVVDVSIEATRAERGFLFMLGRGVLEDDDDTETTLPLIPVVERDPLDQKKGYSPLNISTTIARKVVREKVAVITRDTGLDPELSSSESIALLNIRSALCVPLWKKEEVIGIIYLDNTSSPNPFSRQDLELLTAIGYQAAIGIERAQLREKMREEELIRHSLERFHSPNIVEMIINESRRPGSKLLQPRELVATVLFSDIADFTKLAERMTPIEVAHLLNDYFGIMTEIIFRHGGTIDKYLGDGIMTVFGAPISSHNDAEKAASVALEMVSATERFSYQLPHPLELKIRIGMNTGKVVAGSIGSQHRMDYTVLGDTVNVASRLEGECSPGYVLVSESTKVLIQHKFQCIFAGERKVKGREQLVRTWWVTREPEHPV